MPADRVLLYGFLALQTDFVQRDQLAAGFRAWAQKKGQPLGQALQDLGVLNADHVRLLDLLLEKNLAKNGHDVRRSLASLNVPAETVQNLREDAADPDILAALSRMENEPAAKAINGTAPASVAPGRFRILKPHARGGHSDIFLAEDVELGRHVALKEILADLTGDTQHHTRFLVEAEITAGLEHPGIVPVYGLGRYDDGRPFYAMRFVHGDTLAAAIQRFHAGRTLTAEDFSSVEFRRMLRQLIDVCNAVAYAHSRGVVHCGLHPAKVMLGQYGETLVTDWSCARIVGEPAARRACQGQLVQPTLRLRSIRTEDWSAEDVGTAHPSYVAPEQSAGEELGPTSDVFSLGAMLYEMLTGQAPEGKSADTLPPAIPKPLEAISRKAMAEKPANRYATALELAAEIENWQANAPVAAWVEPTTLRAARWLKKHSGVVAGAATLALAVFLMLVASLIMLSRDRRELIRERDTLQEQHARSRSDDVLLEQRYNEATKAYAEAVEGLRRLRVSGTSSATDRHRLAQSLMAAARAEYLAGVNTEEWLREAAGILEKLRQEFPTVSDYSADLSQCEHALRELRRRRQN